MFTYEEEDNWCLTIIYQNLGKLTSQNSYQKSQKLSSNDATISKAMWCSGYHYYTPSFNKARIIWYGTTVRYFPMRLSQPFVKTAISDEESVADAELLSSYLKVISRDEKEILKRNLEQIDEEKVDLLDAL